MHATEHLQTVSLHPTDRCLLVTTSPRHTFPHGQQSVQGLSEWPRMQSQIRDGQLITSVTDAQVMAARQRPGGQLTLWRGQLRVSGVRDPDRDRDLRRLSSWTWQDAPVTRLRDLDATVRICRNHRVAVPAHLPNAATVDQVTMWCERLERQLRDRQHWLPVVTGLLFQQMLLTLWMSGASERHLAQAAETLTDALSRHDYSKAFAGLDPDSTDRHSLQLLMDLGLTVAVPSVGTQQAG